MKKKDLDFLEFKNKYKRKIEKKLGKAPTKNKQVSTRDYDIFKKSFMPKQLNFYEKMCNFSEKIIPVKPSDSQIPKIEEAIKTSHLNITPTSTYSFAIVMSFIIIILGTFLGYVIPVVLTGGESIQNYFFILFSVSMALVLFIPMTKIPYIVANMWRMKASNQMVLSIFYIVTYMRHTPNLELAIDFAAEHLAPPLSLDFKKVVWNIETGKYDSITESLDAYLETWRQKNNEFIEAMHLIQGSLYENSEVRRQSSLDKSLDVILDETYEKMLHYTHNLKTPITTLHMLGIVLPILGLVILPLLTAFVPSARWYHLFALYNIFLPVLVYYIGRDVLSTRPSGYGGVDMSELEEEEAENNEVKLRYKGKKKLQVTPFMAAITVFTVIFLIGIIPIVVHQLNPQFDLLLTSNGLVTPAELDVGERIYIQFLDYRTELQDGQPTGNLIGPYGLGAALFSLLIPLSFSMGLFTYYKLRTKDHIKVREETKELEQEFASALFQLGNRLGDGVPAEIAFGNVSKVMNKSKSAKFFDIVTINISKLGMGVRDAIFNKEVGAIKFFPSSIIESSMKVFIESIQKGPKVASQALITVAEYIKSMHRVDERLQDLLADIVSSMKSQINFLTPIIAGIVVGITSMISQILGALSSRLDDLSIDGVEGTAGVPGGAEGVLNTFGSGGIPTYHFQIIVGLYVVQITFILSIMINGIENGVDEISKEDMLKRNLASSALLYTLITGFFTIAFNIIAGGIVAGL